eukprot:1144867-Pelagomonas_calceolata.AAC.3
MEGDRAGGEVVNAPGDTVGEALHWVYTKGVENAPDIAGIQFEAYPSYADTCLRSDQDAVTGMLPKGALVAANHAFLASLPEKPCGAFARLQLMGLLAGGQLFKASANDRS